MWGRTGGPKVVSAGRAAAPSVERRRPDGRTRTATRRPPPRPSGTRPEVVVAPPELVGEVAQRRRGRVHVRDVG
jgi:hypothetical protein